MKTKIVVEVESPDRMDNIFPEEGQTEKHFVGKEDKLEEFRKNYVGDLHKYLVDSVLGYFKKCKDGSCSIFEEDMIDGFEGLYIEGFDEFENYGVEVSAKIFKD